MADHDCLLKSPCCGRLGGHRRNVVRRHRRHRLLGVRSLFVHLNFDSNFIWRVFISIKVNIGVGLDQVI